MPYGKGRGTRETAVRDRMTVGINLRIGRLALVADLLGRGLFILAEHLGLKDLEAEERRYKKALYEMCVE